MSSRLHFLPDIILWAVAAVSIALLWRWAGAIGSSRARLAARSVLLFCFGMVTAATAFRAVRFSQYVPLQVVTWTRALGLLINVGVLYTAVVIRIALRLSRVPTNSGNEVRVEGSSPGSEMAPSRRTLLRLGGAAAVVTPIAVGTFAFLRREDLVFREVAIPIKGLPKDLDRLRIMQLSDIHLSPFLHESTLARAVDMANEARPHLTVVTGDLISIQSDPLDNCLKQVARLRSDAGTFGCHGNHEIYAGCEAYATTAGARLGISFLRQESRLLRFGDARLNIAGVDYQRRGRKYLPGAEWLLARGATNLLLCHNPDPFPVAADMGYDVMLAGHTHGGQVNVEILDHHINVARFLTPYVYGLYSRGTSTAYVTRGIGTIGVPMRLGAPPEIVLLTLCAT